MRKCLYVIFLIVFLPSLSIGQIDAEAIFVWDNDRGKSRQDNPSVGMFNNSEGFAAWDDARWGDYDVFGQEYNMERGLVGKNFPISIKVTASETSYLLSGISCSIFRSPT